MKNFYTKLLSLAVLFFSLSGFSQTTFNYTGTIETYTVPAGVSEIQIETRGAQGGFTGGLGAIMIGTFTVTPGQVLEILVGGEGVTNTASGQQGGSGGGGTFVVDQTTGNPLIVSGGGGGGAEISSYGSYTVPYNATITDAQLGQDGATTTAGSGGGTGGNGGGAGAVDCCLAGNVGGSGGGGFFTDGENGSPGTWGNPSLGGQAYVNGGAGGVCGSATSGYPVSGAGGFGGGGGSAMDNAFRAGGGGGYSGGQGSAYISGSAGYLWGGGGGSFNSGTNQSNSIGNTGNGQVIITEVCDGLVTTVSDDTVCVGDQVILHASSTGSGVITWSGGITDSVAFTPPAGTTTYTATSSDGQDCAFTIDIFVGDYPTADAGTDVSICEGDSVQLVGTGSGTDLSWDGGVVDGQWFTPSTSGTTTYTLTVSVDSTGCTTTDAVDVTYNVIDLTVNYSGGGLSSATSGASYQWIDCADSSDVVGATSQGFTPSQNGDYAVIINLGGCIDTSACQTVGDVGVFGFTNNTDFAVYPNPATNMVTIRTNGSFNYTISDAAGRIVMEGEGMDQVDLEITEFETGTYIVIIQGDDNYTTRLIKR